MPSSSVAARRSKTGASYELASQIASCRIPNIRRRCTSQFSIHAPIEQEMHEISHLILCLRMALLYYGLSKECVLGSEVEQNILGNG